MQHSEQHRAERDMEVFDKIVAVLDRWLQQPPPSPTEEGEHYALLEESSGRVRSAVRAIKTGHLIGDSSATAQQIRETDGGIVHGKSPIATFASTRGTVGTTMASPRTAMLATSAKDSTRSV